MFTNLVQVFQSQNDFSDVNPDFVFGKLFPLVEMGEQFASIDVI